MTILFSAHHSYVLCFLVGGSANGKRREGEEGGRGKKEKGKEGEKGRKVRREEQLFLTPSYLMLLFMYNHVFSTLASKSTITINN